MFIEYRCPICDCIEWHIEIIPKKLCPNCEEVMEVIEE